MPLVGSDGFPQHPRALAGRDQVPVGRLGLQQEVVDGPRAILGRGLALAAGGGDGALDPPAGVERQGGAGVEPVVVGDVGEEGPRAHARQGEAELVDVGVAGVPRREVHQGEALGEGAAPRRLGRGFQGGERLQARRTRPRPLQGLGQGEADDTATRLVLFVVGAGLVPALDSAVRRPGGDKPHPYEKERTQGEGHPASRDFHAVSFHAVTSTGAASSRPAASMRAMKMSSRVGSTARADSTSMPWAWRSAARRAAAASRVGGGRSP